MADSDPDASSVSPRAEADALRLSLRADKAEMIEAGLALQAFFDTREIEAKARYSSELTFEELASNVVKYAYGDPGPAGADIRPLELRVEIAPRTVRMIFEDRGRPFDPTEHRPAPPPEDLDSAPIGGLGLMMVRQAAFEMRYERSGEVNRTEVVIAR